METSHIFVQRVTDAIYEMTSRLGDDDADTDGFIYEIVKAAFNSADIEAFRTWHIDRTIETAIDRDGCYHFDQYLTAVWGDSPQALPSHRNEGGEVWHDSNGQSRFSNVYERCRDREATHCLCGHECGPLCRYVDESYSGRGHVLMSQDHQQSCLTCGALYDVLVDDDGTAYLAGHGGEAPRQCSQRTDLVHGPADLRVCESADGMECDENQENGTCEHVDHDCDCLLCVG